MYPSGSSEKIAGPRTGIFESAGIGIMSMVERTAADVYGLPTYAEKPMPKMVSTGPWRP